MAENQTIGDWIAGHLRTVADPARTLVDLVSSGTTSTEDILLPAIDILKSDPEFAAIWACAERNDSSGILKFVSSGTLYRVLTSDLAQTIICGGLIRFYAFELILTIARRALLMELTQSDSETLDPPKHIFLCALAQQCFLNEYAYWENADETPWVEILKESLEIVSEAGDALLPHLVALYACYRAPLTATLSDESLRQLGELEDPHFARFFARTMQDPRVEKDLKEAFERITPIDDQISQAVRQQYEESPYPRWFTATKSIAAPTATVLKSFNGIDLNQFGDVTCPRILVAGCGTGQNILHFAGMFADADVTAVDLSRASLAHAKLHCDRLGLKVRYAQADILGLPATGLKFDIIECAGVLHHMKDPLAGGRALAACLRPGGFMRIGVYTAAGRNALSAARRFIERGGYAPTPPGIRRFRRDLIAELAGPRLMKGMLFQVMSLRDFYSLSMCRDLVFHVQEHAYTVGQIQEFTQNLGLRLASIAFVDQPDLVRWDSNAGVQGQIRHVEQLERDGQIGSSLYFFLAQKPL